MIEMIEISKKEYDELVNKSYFLNCLEACGVDNWEGYGIAQDMYDEEE
jgi:hypothetical protein